MGNALLPGRSRFLVLAMVLAGMVVVPPVLAGQSEARPCLRANLLNLYGHCAAEPAPAQTGRARAGITAARVARDGGRWRTHRLPASRLGARDGVVLELAAAPVRGSYGKPLARLLIRCRDNATNVMIAFDGRVMSDRREKSELFYRLDGGEERIVELSLSEDPSVMGIWHGFRAVPFVKTLAGGSQLRMTAWDRDGARLDLDFAVAGLDRALGPVRARCGWH